MTNNPSLHPSVRKFKEFVKAHPLLVNEVREGKKVWQDLYEEWVILGEHHENWEQYKMAIKEDSHINEHSTTTKSKESNEETEKKAESSQTSEALTHLIGFIKNMNFDDIQRHMSQLNGILSNVQQLMGTFQGGQKQPQQQQSEPPHDPFSFRGF